MRIFKFNELDSADLIIDAVYEGGNAGNAGDDPISKFIPGIGNMAGFRHSGQGEQKKIVVLYTSGENKDWPDTLEVHSGKFTYYGDNRTPGNELHDTPRKGNTILRNVFSELHSSEAIQTIPPFFIFSKFPTQGSSRSVQFKGLAVPGYAGVPATEDLVAVWKTTNNQRFQNYRATFTILNVPQLDHNWLMDLNNGNSNSEHAPAPWRIWRENRTYHALKSVPTTITRSAELQKPQNALQEQILSVVFNYFKDTPIAFERFAARIFQLHDSRVVIDEITRGTIDGGRDAIGRYILGIEEDPVYVEFALEAKCYQPAVGSQRPNTIGVKEVARLISRLLHRQFGVLVTTSIIANQAYKEVREDKHPVIFICGKDITEILISKGYNTVNRVEEFLSDQFST
ncbi:MAG: restriction endonuclease [SAR324 cluster bacterium]|nr:restriction endonuclease [SAR324 cluster bacterium]